MKVEINVDETQFNDILEKELRDLPKEVLQNIIAESIRGYFQQDNYKNVEKIFIQDCKNSYNYYNSKEASELLKSVLKDCNYSELQEVVDEAINTLKNEHYNILKNILTDVFIQGLTQDYKFRESLESVLNEVLIRRSNS